MGLLSDMKSVHLLCDVSSDSHCTGKASGRLDVGGFCLFHTTHAVMHEVHGPAEL